MSQSVFLFKSEKPGNPGNVFSNWYPATFVMPERKYISNDKLTILKIPANNYVSTEQGMMEAKALLCKAYETANMIMSPYLQELPTSTQDWENWHKYQSNIKKLGGPTGIPNYNEAAWSAIRYKVVKDLNRQKFLQNQELMDELINTENITLAEGAFYDKIWGIGLSKTHQDAQYPSRWRGQNLLGKLLMELRNEFNE